jgi:hypothetical protein
MNVQAIGAPTVIVPATIKPPKTIIPVDIKNESTVFMIAPI